MRISLFSLTVRPGVEAVVQGRVELRHVAHAPSRQRWERCSAASPKEPGRDDTVVFSAAAAAEANGGARPRAIVAIKAQATGLFRLACVVLLIAHLLHPGHDSCRLGPGHCQVRHGGGRRRTVPVLHAWRARNDVAGADDLRGLAPLLRQSDAGGNDEALSRSDAYATPNARRARTSPSHPRR